MSFCLRSVVATVCVIFTFTLILIPKDVKAFSFLGNLKIPSLDKMKAKMDADKKFGGKRVVVITGTSSGLGKHTAKQLLEDGNWHVIGAVRDLEKMEVVAEVEGNWGGA